MSKTKSTPVYKGDFQSAALLKAYLEGDELKVKMIPNVKSPPAHDRVTHAIKSQFTEFVLLVPEEQLERANELIEDYMKKEPPPEGGRDSS